MSLVIAIAAIALGGFSSLSLFVLFIAGSPNSSAQQWRLIRNLLWATAIGGIAVVAISIWLITRGHAWWAAALGASPIAAWIVVIGMASVRR